MQIPKLREWREARALTQVELAERAGVSSRSIAGYEAGGGARPPTVRKLADALDVGIADLLEEASPKGSSRSSLETSLSNGLDDERRAAWEAAVVEGRRLRETGRGRMWKALSEWSASKQRREPYAASRGYLDEMEDQLQEAYGAYTAVEDALREAIEAAFTPGGRKASVPSYLQKETRAATDFYIELFGLVSSVGLSVSAGDDAAAANRAAKAQPEARPHRVEDPEAA